MKDANNSPLPEHIRSGITELGKKHGIRRIILFGSRARGDHRRTSDVDLAISGGDAASFTLDIEEEIPTLLMFDVVNTDRPVQKDLIHAIEREGRVLYEKS